MKVEECRIEGMGIKKWKGKPTRYLGTFGTSWVRRFLHPDDRLIKALHCSLPVLGADRHVVRRNFGCDCDGGGGADGACRKWTAQVSRAAMNRG